MNKKIFSTKILVKRLILKNVKKKYLLNFFPNVPMRTPLILTRISCKDSRKGSSEKNIRSNFIVLSILKCKMEHFKPNFMNLVPGVFEIRYTLFM